MRKQDIQTVLDALKQPLGFTGCREIDVKLREAITICEAALTEPSEPVAEVAGDYNTKHIIFLPAGIALEVGDKLFTRPASKPSEPKPYCCYCESANEGIRSTYFDQTCEGCVKRMTHPAKPSPLTDEEIDVITANGYYCPNCGLSQKGF